MKHRTQLGPGPGELMKTQNSAWPWSRGAMRTHNHTEPGDLENRTVIKSTCNFTTTKQNQSNFCSTRDVLYTCICL